MTEINSTEGIFYNTEEVHVFDCHPPYHYGYVSLLILLMSLLCNSLILVAFHRLKRKKFNFEYLIVALAVLNLLGSGHMVFFVYFSFSCRIMDLFTCYLSSFVMFFVACASIYLIVFISFERYCMVRNSGKKTFLRYQFEIAFSIMLGLLWSVFPLIGWSRYSTEGIPHCSIEFNDRSFNVVSYNVTVFIFVFLLPFGVIFITSYKIVSLVNDNDKKFTNSKARNMREKKLTMNLVILVVGFLVTWTPYGIISLYNAFIDGDILPVFKLIPAIFAKSSLFFSTGYYLLTNQNLMNSLTGEPERTSSSNTFHRSSTQLLARIRSQPTLFNETILE